MNAGRRDGPEAAGTTRFHAAPHKPLSVPGVAAPGPGVVVLTTRAVIREEAPAQHRAANPDPCAAVISHRDDAKTAARGVKEDRVVGDSGFGLVVDRRAADYELGRRDVLLLSGLAGGWRLLLLHHRTVCGRDDAAPQNGRDACRGTQQPPTLCFHGLSPLCVCHRSITPD